MVNDRYIRSLVVSVSLFLALAVSPAALGQVVNGDLVGTVLDKSGSAVPGAQVEALRTATGTKFMSTTGAEGQYRIGNLPAGQYRITASASGFTTSAVDGVAIDANKVSTINMTLEVGQLSQTVEVTAAPAVIDTTTATVQNTFDTTASRDLPVASIGLGSANLALLNAGVASNGGLGVGEGPSIGGQRPYNNNFMIEGVDNNNKTVTGSLIRFIPNDAVAEFTVLQNQMSAEFGHSSGGQFNTIIKSGTNEIHGSAYDYFQNRYLNAIDQQVQNAAFDAGERPKNTRYDSNRFGASVGGPILKNKLFYFGNFEYNPVGLVGTPVSVYTPTAEGYSILENMPGLSKTNLDVLKQYAPAAPNTQGTISVQGQDIPVGLPSLYAPNYQNNYFAVASSDYNISDRDQLRGRFLYNKLSQIDTNNITFPAFFELATSTYYVTTLSEYHTFTPAVNNELRLGYNRLNGGLSAGDFKYPGLDAFPSFQINELGIQLGPDPQAPQSGVQNTYQISDNVTWNKGNHTLKFGFDGRKYIAPSSFTQRPRGEYHYSTLDVFLLDLTPDEEAQRGIGNYVYYGDQIAAYEYVNDSWRVRPNLTINLGLRHEYTTIPYSSRLQKVNDIASVPGVLVFKEPQPQTKNFAPRVGFAYSPGTSGKTSIRAGFGMAYDVIYDNIGELSLPPQFSTTVDVTNNGNKYSGAPNFLKNGGILPNTSTGNPSVSDLRALTAAYVPDQHVPYSIQWNFGIQHVFHDDYTFEARYLGTRGVHLDVQERINKLSIVTPTHYLPTYLQQPSQATLDALPLTLGQLENESNLVPKYEQAGFTNPALVENSFIGNSSYHGLALQLNRRFSHGLQFVASYTWSHLIDDSTADFFSTVLTPRRPQDFQNLRAEKASSALDHRHRFTLAGVWEAPWFAHSSHRLLKNVVGNWEIAPIYTYETPEYVTVQSQLDSNLNGDSWADRTIVNPAGNAGAGSGVIPLCKGGGTCDPSDPGVDDRIVGYLATNPNARYIQAGIGALATAGRNTLPGRPINNWDVNLLKNFNVNERIKMQFSAQLFNALNHPQFVPGYVNRADNPPAPNTSPAVRNYVSAGSPIFNNPEAVYSSNPRSIQLSLKLMF